MAKRHLELSIKWKGEKLAIFETRRHYHNYFKGIENIKKFKDRIVGIGETGLDYHYDIPKNKQIESLEIHLDAASVYNLPCIIHMRDAEEDMIKILTKYSKKIGDILIHCFTGSEEFAKKCMHEAGVAIVPGTAFGKTAKDYVRFSFAASSDNISQALDKIKKIL